MAVNIHQDLVLKNKVEELDFLSFQEPPPFPSTLSRCQLAFLLATPITGWQLIGLAIKSEIEINTIRKEFEAHNNNLPNEEKKRALEEAAEKISAARFDRLFPQIGVELIQSYRLELAKICYLEGNFDEAYQEWLHYYRTVRLPQSILDTDPIYLKREAAFDKEGFRERCWISHLSHDKPSALLSAAIKEARGMHEAAYLSLEEANHYEEEEEIKNLQTAIAGKIH